MNKSSIKMSYAPITSMYLIVLVMSLKKEVSNEKANARYPIFYLSTWQIKRKRNEIYYSNVLVFSCCLYFIFFWH